MVVDVFVELDALSLVSLFPPDIFTFFSNFGWFFYVLGTIPFVLGLYRQLIVGERLNRQVLLAEKKYRHLVDNSEVAILLLDKMGEITFTNPIAAYLFRSSVEKLKGQSFYDLVFSKDLFDFKKYFHFQMVDDHSQPEFDFRVAYDETQWVRCRISHTPTEIGHYQCYLWDITNEKRFQELQEQFIASTSHELRTPITVIKGYTEFLSRHDTISEGKRREIYGHLNRNIFRLNKLVETVHDLARIRSHYFELHPERVDLAKFWLDLYEQLRILYPATRFFVNLLCRNGDEVAYFDPHRFMQVVHNLVSNSVKNSPLGSMVSVTINKQFDLLQVIVEDQGTGIPQDLMFRLFRPFVHESTEFSVHSTGLGLYIVKTIVDAHHGTIELQTQEGEGTTFTIIIPL